MIEDILLPTIPKDITFIDPTGPDEWQKAPNELVQWCKMQTPHCTELREGAVGKLMPTGQSRPGPLEPAAQREVIRRA